MKRMSVRYRFALWGCGIFACGCAVAALPDVPAEAMDEMGYTYGIPQTSGFVFIEGRYIAAPYTVTRKGNGIFINRIQIEQPVAWSFVTGVTEPPAKTLDADGDFEVVDPAAVTPATVTPAVAEPAAPAAPRQVKSIDDLFADDAPPAEPAAPDAAGGEAMPAETALDGTVAGLAPDPARLRTPEEVKRLKDEVRIQLDARRQNYEQALSRGEIYFFGQRHSRLNGNYGTARTLMGVLPAALRNAQSPHDLLQRLNQGGVYFVDLAVCSALYKNKVTFPLLEERLKRIEETEAAEAAKRIVPLSR